MKLINDVAFWMLDLNWYSKYALAIGSVVIILLVVYFIKHKYGLPLYFIKHKKGSPKWQE